MGDGSAGTIAPERSGYVVQVETHTHTPTAPMPPRKGDDSAHAYKVAYPSGGQMRPGVTTKDLRLAEAVEEVHRELTGNMVI
jgi:hypothetical protein